MRINVACNCYWVKLYFLCCALYSPPAALFTARVELLGHVWVIFHTK